MKKILLIFLFLSLNIQINSKETINPIESIEKIKLIEQQKKYLTATVRNTQGVCLDELRALDNRFWYSLNSLEKYLDTKIDLNNMPLIGLACSGGGFRATVTALGLVKALQKIKLLDSVIYFSTLSGSTWLAASWLTQQKNLDDLEKYLRNKMHESFFLKKINEEAIAIKLWNKLKTGRPLSINDIYGGILGNIFLDLNDKNYGQNVFITDMAPKVLSGVYPIPIFTSALGQTSPYQWAEFTPFEVGSEYLHSWISPDAFGKEFEMGKSFDKTPSEDFAYLLGLFGSAYAVSIDDILTQVINYITHLFNPSIKGKDRDLLSNFILAFTDLQRLSPPTVYNFTYKLEKSPLNLNKYLTFIDAGFAINLPVPPLLRRNLNVYIICDTSADGLFAEGSEFKKTIEYAKQNNIPFPNINLETINKKAVNIFYDDKNDQIPTVIYIPNFIDTSTINFNYDQKDFDNILNNIEQTIITNADIIKNAIKRAANIKYGKIDPIKKV